MVSSLSVLLVLAVAVSAMERDLGDSGPPSSSSSRAAAPTADRSPRSGHSLAAASQKINSEDDIPTTPKADDDGAKDLKQKPARPHIPHLPLERVDGTCVPPYRCVKGVPCLIFWLESIPEKAFASAVSGTSVGHVALFLSYNPDTIISPKQLEAQEFADPPLHEQYLSWWPADMTIMSHGKSTRHSYCQDFHDEHGPPQAAFPLPFGFKGAADENSMQSLLATDPAFQPGRGTLHEYDVGVANCITKALLLLIRGVIDDSQAETDNPCANKNRHRFLQLMRADLNNLYGKVSPGEDYVPGLLPSKVMPFGTRYAHMLRTMNTVIEKARGPDYECPYFTDYLRSIADAGPKFGDQYYTPRAAVGVARSLAEHTFVRPVSTARRIAGAVDRVSNAVAAGTRRAGNAIREAVGRV